MGKQRGTADHDYVYVDDVVDAFMRAGCAAIEIDRDIQHRHRTAPTLTEVRHGD